MDTYAPRWWVRDVDREVRGPWSAADIATRIRDGQLTAGVEVSRDRLLWGSAAEHPEFRRETTMAPFRDEPPMPRAPEPAAGPVGLPWWSKLALVGGPVLLVAAFAAVSRTAPAPARPVAAPPPVATAPAPLSARERDVATRRANAARINRGIRRERDNITTDSTGEDDTVLRFRSDWCNPQMLGLFDGMEATLLAAGFRRAICVTEAGVLVAERTFVEGRPDAPDPIGAFEAYLAPRFPGATVAVSGSDVHVRGVRCSRRFFDAVGRMVDAPDLFERALGSFARSVVCEPGEGAPVARHWPAAGATIPAPVEWRPSFVVTPVRSRIDPSRAPVWCFEPLGAVARPDAWCSRRVEGCERGRDESVAGMALNERTTGRAATPLSACLATDTLWCFQPPGRDQVCTRSSDRCEAARAALDVDDDCEQRYAL